MRFLWYILISCFSGVFAGMGMGGGTFLIPLLSIIFGVEQIICQSTNVLCFVVLSIICAIIYFKDKLVNLKVLLSVAIPASIIASLGSLFALKISSNILRILFAGFVILVGVIYFVVAIIELKNTERQEAKKQQAVWTNKIS